MRRKQPGYTIMELLIVIILIGVIAALAMPSVIEGLANARTTEASNDVVSLFRRARTQAMRNKRAMGIEIGGGSNNIIALSPGANNLCSSTTGAITYAGAIEIVDFNKTRFTHFNVRLAGFTATAGGTVVAGTSFCISGTGRLMVLAGTWTRLDTLEFTIDRTDGGVPVGVQRVVVVNNMGTARVLL